MNDFDYSKLTFETVNDQGIEVICDLLSSYHNEDTDKTYVAFTDYTLEENNDLKLYIKELVQDGEENVLKDIEDKDVVLKLKNDVFRNVF